MKLAHLPSIVTGILIGTSYIPFPPWAIFFCFIPLWNYWLKQNDGKKVFIAGWISQFTLTLIGFNWVAYTVHEFGHLPWPLAILVLFIFCAFANLHIPLAGWCWFHFCRMFGVQGPGRLWALPIFVAFGERLFPMIFDWHFGYTWLWAGFPAFHLADTIGFIGLSNIGLFFNAMALQAYLNRLSAKSWKLWLTTPILIFLSLNTIGWWRGQNPPTNDAKLRILLVQANIGNQEKLMAEAGARFRDVVLERFARLTEQGLKEHGSVDFAVWPETAFPELIVEPNLYLGYASKLKELITKWDSKLITGGYSELAQTEQITNSFFILDKTGKWLSPPYHKTILLAFGEYFPGANWFPSLSKTFPQVGNFGRGPGPTILNAGELRVGAQICYESLFDWFSRDLALKGAQILVNLTNDSWYGKWMEPYQHGYMTLARAIEVRRPLIRSTNTGISTVILADGSILPLSPLHEEWFHLYEVPYASNPQATPFMGWGFWLIPSLLILGLATILWSRRRQTS